MLLHCSRIDRLDVPARAIFSSPAVFKREALGLRYELTCTSQLNNIDRVQDISYVAFNVLNDYFSNTENITLPP